MSYRGSSSSDKDSSATITPGSSPSGPWPVVTLDEIENSASPYLKATDRKMPSKIQRTPQPTLSQAKLTGSGMLQLQGLPGPGNVHPAALVPENQGPALALPASVPPQQSADTMTEQPTSMDTAPPAASNLVTTDFLLRSLKENTDYIIQSFNHSLGLLAQKVDGNTRNITSNADAIRAQATTTDVIKADVELLNARVRALEDGRGTLPNVASIRHPLSHEYLTARRSARLWPVIGSTEEDMWGGVGEFLHETMAIPDEEVCQEDIESIRRAPSDAASGLIRDEVIVTFKDKKKRDLVMVNSVNLAKCVDSDGKPTAGTRLEIPSELMDTFRLLSRFGTRLRARHGEGTRRHVKFDDHLGSLYSNIKLPGDSTWTRVSPEMAQEDLAVSMKEENASIQRRLAVKLVPGPRQRLGLPVMGPNSVAPAKTAPASASSRPGKRPRWAAPSRGNAEV